MLNLSNVNSAGKINSKLIMALAAALLLVACKSTPIKTAPVEDRTTVPSTSTTQSGGNGADTGADTGAVKEVMIDSSANEGDSGNPLKDPKNILSQRAIFFDYNSDAIRAEFRPLVEAHAKYLLSHSSAKMILQGNTDERGAREYNLSLGQRRAVAAKKALNLLGVQDTQIETVSYGEERASQNCGDEDCFIVDRRVDIVYETE